MKSRRSISECSRESAMALKELASADLILPSRHLQPGRKNLAFGKLFAAAISLRGSPAFTS
jgi:hypothetical protein